MTIRLFTLAILVMLPVAVFAQQQRYYGVDNHASVASACTPTSRSSGPVKMYIIAGDQCEYFTTLFFTSRFPRTSGVDSQTQEDDLLAKSAVILEQGLVVVSAKGPKDRTIDGVAGREELIKFKKDISDGYIREFSDDSVAGKLYVTAVVVTMNPFAVQRDSAAATTAVSQFLDNIQVSSGSN